MSSTLPLFSPMLATLIEEPFDSPDWVFEVKWDGIRALIYLEDEKISLISRNRSDISSRYPELSALSSLVEADNAIIDGEIVSFDGEGRPSFQLLQQRMNISDRNRIPHLSSSIPVSFIAFDLLFLNDADITSEPFIKRRERLLQVWPQTPSSYLSEAVPAEGKALFRVVKEKELEGIVAKRALSRYLQSRSREWLKVKSRREVDAIICGFTLPRGARKLIGALLLGLYAGKELRFVGHVGTGFSQQTLTELWEQFQNLKISFSPFPRLPETNETPFWLEPRLVCQVKYNGWTEAGRLRSPVYQRLRSDKAAEECVLDDLELK